MSKYGRINVNLCSQISTILPNEVFELIHYNVNHCTNFLYPKTAHSIIE